MRIAYFTNVYARASDTFIRNEVLELRARGHVVETFSIRRAAADAAVSAEVAAEQATTCYILSVPKARLAATIVRTAATRFGPVVRALALAMRISPAGLRARTMHVFYWLEAVYLAHCLRARGIELLHNHIAENSATVAMLAAQIAGVPFSMTVHGPGIFFHPRFWALGEKIARAAFTACITDFCKSQCMLHSDMRHWARLAVVRCGVGRQFEQLAQVPVPQAPRLLFVGRLCEEKGLPLLVEAVARLVQSGARCELAIVGDGPLKGYLERFIADRGLADAIVLLGWRDSAGVAQELNRSRALVLPSFAEGLPVVIMEAMAMGRPVVTTAIAGIPELVRDGHNGWMVPAGAVDALGDALREVVQADAARLDEMGRAGMRMVREQHSVGTEVGKLEAQFLDTLRARRAAAAAG
ncbi:glycosyltransferase [Pseudorhodoferax sp.]|uniref:glycosyltransferase n=1 Tax=Pseudorhodoferax sp. TaxID=1993553 RepID=UPI002DD62790|nr:glycosyltransferase [Pseudorhodoferax sp.]